MNKPNNDLAEQLLLAFDKRFYISNPNLETIQEIRRWLTTEVVELVRKKRSI